jgi:hypothetical protein
VNTGDLPSKPQNYQTKSEDLLDALPTMFPDVFHWLSEDEKSV